MVVPMQIKYSKNYTEFQSSDYRATCLIGTRPIRELKFDLQHPNLMLFRCNWTGNFLSTDVKPKRKNRKRPKIELGSSYSTLLPISKAKFEDLQVLKQFLLPTNQPFYDMLPKMHVEPIEDIDSL